MKSTYQDLDKNKLLYSIKSTLIKQFHLLANYESTSKQDSIQQIIFSMKEEQQNLKVLMDQFFSITGDSLLEENKTDQISMSGFQCEPSQSSMDYQGSLQSQWLDPILAEIGSQAITQIFTVQEYLTGMHSLFQFVKENAPVEEQRKFCGEVYNWFIDCEDVQGQKQAILKNSFTKMIKDFEFRCSKVEKWFQEIQEQLTQFQTRLKRPIKNKEKLSNELPQSSSQQKVSEEKPLEIIDYQSLKKVSNDYQSSTLQQIPKEKPLEYINIQSKQKESKDSSQQSSLQQITSVQPQGIKSQKELDDENWAKYLRDSEMMKKIQMNSSNPQRKY